MDEALQKKVTAYRAITFKEKPGERLHSLDEAVRYVDQRSFIFFWPIKGVVFPSLWTAVTGTHTVANDHDDPGHITWDWKDRMLGQRRWYYGRVLRKKNAILSLEAFLHFYALTPNYGEYEVDYLSQYQQGLMTAEAKAIYEALLFNGPMDTISLRKTARMTSKSSTSRFQRALDQLQVEMKILPTGISEAGAWKYAFIYDIVPRHFPDIEERSRSIQIPQARRFLLEKCLLALGLADFSTIKKLFHWKDRDLKRTIQTLQEESALRWSQIELEKTKALILDELM